MQFGFAHEDGQVQGKTCHEGAEANAQGRAPAGVESTESAKGAAAHEGGVSSATESESNEHQPEGAKWGVGISRSS